MNKLSPSAIVDYLRSPKLHFWKRVYNNGAGLEPLEPSVQRYDHDKSFGVVWAKFVEHFYLGFKLKPNLDFAMSHWRNITDGWVEDKVRQPYDLALSALVEDYYNQFSPDDGMRSGGSEVWLESEFVRGRADGLFHGDSRYDEENVLKIHEVKTTSRAPQLAEQLWKVENSIQVKTYTYLADATGVCVEFAFKDPPHTTYRAPIRPITAVERSQWRAEIEGLARHILSLGGKESDYPCNPDGCCLVTKRFVGMCPYQVLCQGNLEVIPYLFKPRRKI
jgi:hypothetical protein